MKGVFGKWAFQIDAIQIDVKHRTLIERDDNAIILASGLTPSDVAESERKRKRLTVVVRFDCKRLLSGASPLRSNRNAMTLSASQTGSLLICLIGTALEGDGTRVFRILL